MTDDTTRFDGVQERNTTEREMLIEDVRNGIDDCRAVISDPSAVSDDGLYDIAEAAYAAGLTAVLVGVALMVSTLITPVTPGVSTGAVHWLFAVCCVAYGGLAFGLGLVARNVPE